MQTPPFDTPYAEEIKARLKQHGCQIEEHQDYYLLIFPPGTKRIQIRQTTTIAPYKIQLPDGSTLYQIDDCMRDISYLQIPRKEVQP
jgi:hypothetical protein